MKNLVFLFIYLILFSTVATAASTPATGPVSNIFGRDPVTGKALSIETGTDPWDLPQLDASGYIPSELLNPDITRDAELGTAADNAETDFESSTSNDFDPDRLAGDTTDDNLVDEAVIDAAIARDTELPSVSADDLISYGYVFHFRADYPVCDDTHPDHDSTLTTLAGWGIDPTNIACDDGFDPLNPTATLVGVSGTGSVGTLAVIDGSAFVAALNGVSGTGSVGTLAVSDNSAYVAGLTGVSGTGSVGTFAVTIMQNGTVALTGVSGTGAIGTLAVTVPASLSVSDDFNRANGAINIGETSWAAAPSHSFPSIASNKVLVSNTTTKYGAYWDDSFSNDQYAEAEITDVGTSSAAGRFVGVLVRQSTSTDTHYRAVVETYGTGENYISLYKNVSGVESILTFAASSFNQYSNIRLEVSGTSLTVKTKTTPGGSYSTTLTHTDSSIASGKPGISLYPQSGANTELVLDNFAAGDL